ncbi:hypothetical protein AABC73_05445 [Pseudomonas sp. G.S.17]|uniref:hypothetical protein n=1 Tax=Pseudomonas sp. G.S.17 TaxID=3137451 RepID=UPI00311CC168
MHIALIHCLFFPYVRYGYGKPGFTVKDRSCHALLLGTKTDSALIETPQSISVVTKDQSLNQILRLLFLVLVWLATHRAGECYVSVVIVRRYRRFREQARSQSARMTVHLVGASLLANRLNLA